MYIRNLQKLILILTSLFFICFCVRNGIHKTYYKSGKLKSKINYKNGKKNGIAYYYDDTENQSIKEIIEYKNGIQHGWTINYEDYDMKKYVKNKLNYHNYQKPVSQCFYNKGIRNGWCFVEFEISVPEARAYNYKKIIFRDGKKRGIAEEKGFDYNIKIYRSLNLDMYVDTPEKYMFKKWPKSKPFKGFVTGDYYHFDNLIDGNKETVWVSRNKNFKRKNLIYLSMNSDNKKVTHLIINNGNQINKKEFKKFSRIKKAKITIVKYKLAVIYRKTYKIFFKDSIETKRIKINDSNVSAFLTVISSYPGTKYKNVSISDFYFEY